MTDAGQRVQPDDIQGNLVGFNKDHQRLLYVNFPTAQSVRGLLAALLAAGEIQSATDTLRINRLVKQVERDGHADRGTIDSSGVNILLSFQGLTMLEAPGLASFPVEFQQDMAARAGVLGDVDDSAPANWIAPFTNGSSIHAVVILAADQPDDLDQRATTVRTLINQNGCSEVGAQDGNVRPGTQSGHEHFGFKDGISQPSVTGLTRSSKGGAEIAAGEFLIGYQDQDGNVSGSGASAPGPGQPGYPNTPATPALPDWAKNGSFVVLRRLRQNVQGFQQWLQANASTAGLSTDQLAAKLVGRWPSGAPMERVPGQPATTDNSTADPSLTNPDVLKDSHINNFGYEALDADGHFVPKAAHIRKTNPRDENPPGHDEANRHRIIRRGIPYGPELQSGEAPYPGSGPVPDTQDRRLIFLCYKSSITRGFEFIQSQWANVPDFPAAGDGNDPIISQNMPAASFAVPPNNVHLTLARWVTTTGGGYYFAPSVAALRLMATNSASVDSGLT